MTKNNKMTRKELIGWNITGILAGVCLLACLTDRIGLGLACGFGTIFLAYALEKWFSE